MKTIGFTFLLGVCLCPCLQGQGTYVSFSQLEALPSMSLKEFEDFALSHDFINGRTFIVPQLSAFFEFRSRMAEDDGSFNSLSLSLTGKGERIYQFTTSSLPYYQRLLFILREEGFQQDKTELAESLGLESFLCFVSDQLTVKVTRFDESGLRHFCVTVSAMEKSEPDVEMSVYPHQMSIPVGFFLLN